MIDRAALLKTSSNGDQIQLEAGFILDEVERAQQFGVTSTPPVGSTCVIGLVDEDNPVILQVGDARYTLSGVASGGVALHDQAGNKVHLNNDGTIVVQASVSITINAPVVNVTSATAINVGTASGAEYIPLGTQLLNWLAAHHHNSSGAAPDLTAHPLTGILSTTVKVQP